MRSNTAHSSHQAYILYFSTTQQRWYIYVARIHVLDDQRSLVSTHINACICLFISFIELHHVYHTLSIIK